MKKQQFVNEFVASLLCEDEDVCKVAKDSLYLCLDLIDYDDYKNLKSINSITKENYVNICAFICGVLNLKSSMTNEEEQAYKYVKEKGKSLNDNFTSIIKQTTSRLSGAMFYRNEVEGQ